MFPDNQPRAAVGLLCLLFLNNALEALGGNAINLVDSQPVDTYTNEPDYLQKFAGYVCNERKSARDDWQISRMSTIHKLGDYFESLPHGHELAKCRDAAIKPLRKLRLLINSSNNNVCSDEKISQIEEFHSKYVSTHKDDLAERDAQVRLPNLLRLFFMHYAMEVSAVCKRNLINSLEWDLRQQLDSRDFDMFKGEVMERVLNTFSKSLVSTEKVSDFDDVLLIWDLIDGFRIDVSNWGPGGPPAEIGDYPDGYKMYMKVSTGADAWKVQHLCRNRFKPIYDQLITPIIRLAGLGYSYKGEHLSREVGELRQNPEVKKWYAITQFCEAILHIGIFQDSSLKKATGALIMAEEANLLRPLQPPMDPSLKAIEKVEFEPSTNSMEGLDQLPDVASAERQELVKKVNLDMNKRSRIMLGSITRILKNLTGLLSVFKMVQLFVTERKEEFKNLNPDGTAKSFDDEYLDVTSLMKRSETLSDTDLLNIEGGLKRDSITRMKKRVRKNDIDTANRNNAAAISYMHTKGLADIFKGWWRTIEALLPSRRMLVIIGFVLMGLGLLAVICTCITAGISGLTAAG